MDFKVIITWSAAKDLRGIIQFIARDNPDAAIKFGDQILERFQTLEKFPLRGRVVPEIQKVEWRELIYGSYRLVYRVDERQKIVYAARVWHAARGSPKIPQ